MNSVASIMPILAAADWIEVVAALVFFIVTGLAQWLQKRSRERRGLDADVETETDVYEGTPPEARETLGPSDRPAETTTRAAWEEQLRRMLKGEQPAVPTRSGEQPPSLESEPVASRTARREWEESPEPPVVSPWQAPRQHHAGRGELSARERISREMARSAEAATAAAQWTESARRATEERLAATRHAYKQAREKVGERASRQLRKVRAGIQPYDIRPRHQGRQRRPPMADAVVQALRHPNTARQTIIAATILQGPKSME